MQSFECLQGGQGFDGKLLPSQSGRRWCSRKGGGSSLGCVVLDTCQGWCESSGLGSLQRASNRFHSLHEMEGGRPWAFGASGGAVPQHCFELGLGDGHAVWCQAARAAGCTSAGGCTDVICCIVLDLPVAPCWLGQSREFIQEALWWCASSDDFALGTDGGAMRTGVNSDVTPSSRRLFLQSKRSP